MGNVQLRVLGEVALWRDGREVSLPPRPLMLLGLLAAHGRNGASADQLIDGLWDSEPPPTANGALRVHISKVRAALEPDRGPQVSTRLATTSGRWVLRLERDEFDAAEFFSELAEADALRASGQVGHAIGHGLNALALWRGQPYGSLDCGQIRAERIRLIHARRRGALAVCEALVGHGEGARAVPVLDELRLGEPYDETLAGLHVRALYQAAGAETALRELRATKLAFADGLGLDAPRGFAELERLLLNSALPGARTSIELTLPHPGGALIGRAPLLEELAAKLREGLVICEGEAGIGKTSLLTALAPGRIHVNAARRPVPFGQVLDVLGQIPAALDDPDWRTLRSAVLDGGTELDPGAVPLLAEDLLTRHLPRDAEVLVDDAEVMDEASASALRSLLLARRLRLLLTRRPAAPGEMERRWSAGHPRVVQVPPLAPDDVRQLAARLDPARAWTDTELAGTGGNPLLVEYAARGADPAGLAARVLEGLGPSAVQAIRFLAVAGSRLPLAAAAALVGPAPLEELLVRRLASLDDGFVGVSHVLLSDAVRGTLGVVAAAQLIAPAVADDSGVPAGLLAEAVTRVESALPKAVLDSWRVRAGAEALRAGGGESASRFFGQVIDASADVQLVADEGLARSLLAEGDLSAARPRMARVMEQLRDLGHDSRLLEVLTHYIGILAPDAVEETIVDSHATWLERRRRLSPEQLVTLAYTRAWATPSDLGTATKRILAECGVAATPRAVLVSLVARWHTSLYVGEHPSNRVTVGTQAVRLAEHVNDPHVQVRALRNHIDDLVALGRGEEAATRTAELRQLASVRWHAQGRWWCDLLDVAGLLLQDDPDRAMAAARAAHARWPRMPADSRDDVLRIQLAVGLYAKRDLQGLLKMLLDTRPPQGHDVLDLAISAARAELGLLDAAQARPIVEAIATLPASRRTHEALYLAGRICAATSTESETLLSRLREWSDVWVTMGTAIGSLGPVAGVLAALEPDTAAAASARAQALDQAGAMRSDWVAQDIRKLGSASPRAVRRRQRS